MIMHQTNTIDPIDFPSMVCFIYCYDQDTGELVNMLKCTSGLQYAKAKALELHHQQAFDIKLYDWEGTLVYTLGI